MNQVIIKTGNYLCEKISSPNSYLIQRKAKSPSLRQKPKIKRNIKKKRTGKSFALKKQNIQKK